MAKVKMENACEVILERLNEQLMEVESRRIELYATIRQIQRIQREVKEEN